jgi:hypothetical protein
VSAGGYESWFVSARDPAAPRALWIRHTTLRPAGGPASAALWCTVVDRGLSGRPVVVKEVGGAFPPGAAAGPGQFRGAAAMAGQAARWDLAITGGPPSLRPLRPAMLYRAPLPRTKLEASVPDGLVTGVLDVDGHQVGVDRWRGTVGHNWGAELIFGELLCWGVFGIYRADPRLIVLGATGVTASLLVLARAARPRTGSTTHGDAVTTSATASHSPRPCEPASCPGRSDRARVARA